MFRFVLLFILILLSACSNCEVETFNRSTLVNPSDQLKVSTVGPTTSSITIDNLVKMTIGDCHPWRNVLCAVITPSPGTRVRFESNEFIEYDLAKTNKLNTHHTNIISYFVECHTKKGHKRICDSSEESPTGLPVDTKARSTEYLGNVSEVIFNKFDSQLEFVGAAELKGHLAWPHTTLTGKREYKLAIILNMNLNDYPRIIEFPKVFINDVAYKLPDVKLSTVTEERCTSTAW